MRPTAFELPPNPYRRQAVRIPGNLAGRNDERRRIRYYLQLTASGQSPHLALIGNRGVGKTSLLNAAEGIARELKLLPIRLDLDPDKTRSLGRFWYELYCAMTMAAAEIGAWGGVSSTLYADLAVALYARKLPELQRAVLQFPLVVAGKDSLDDLECPLPLITHDFQGLIDKELKALGLSGLAILIDEADCLSSNVAILQMLRNAFQRVDRASLLMAGTEAVFPSISDIFSPIPRQFHRIDVSPFSTWTDTRRLVSVGLPGDLMGKIGPQTATTRELHDLCGGDPAELQLYCHHMYQLVERGELERMALHPKVFKVVLHEYRSQMPTDIVKTVTAIEELPSSLFKTNWLRRRKLTLEQNTQVATLAATLLAPTTIDKVEASIKTGHELLFQKGITTSKESLEFVGAPLTSGFFKSYAEVVKGTRWLWKDLDLRKCLHEVVADWLRRHPQIARVGRLGEQTDAVDALLLLRNSELPKDIDQSGLTGIMDFVVNARKQGAERVTDLLINLSIQDVPHRLRMLFLNDITEDNARKAFTLYCTPEWDAALAAAGVKFEDIHSRRWTLPTNDEIQLLAYMAEVPIVDESLGEQLQSQAIAHYSAGRITEAIAAFKRMLSYRTDAQVQNNLGFCLSLKNSLKEAAGFFQLAATDEFRPLFEHNAGLLAALTDQRVEGTLRLERALRWVDENPDIYDPANDAMCMLMIDSKNQLRSEDNIPVDVAIASNLATLGRLTKSDVITRLKRYPRLEPELLKQLQIDTSVAASSPDASTASN